MLLLKVYFRKEECQRENQLLKKTLKAKEDELATLKEDHILLQDEHFALQVSALFGFYLIVKCFFSC